jgi:hypothetical protein
VKKIKSLFKLHTRRNLGFTRKSFSSLPSPASSGVSLSRTLFSFSSSPSSSLVHQHSPADIDTLRTQLLRRSSPREVLNGLKAITRLSSKSPVLLLADSSRNSQPLLSEILLLTRDSDAVIRESAYNICLRFVQHSSTFSSSSGASSTPSDTHHHPSSTSSSTSAFVGYKEGKMAIVRNLIERLSDSDEEVRMTALHFGVDFYPHSIGGLAEDLLLRKFLLGKASGPHLKLILQTNTATLSRG